MEARRSSPSFAARRRGHHRRMRKGSSNSAGPMSEPGEATRPQRRALSALERSGSASVGLSLLVAASLDAMADIRGPACGVHFQRGLGVPKQHDPVPEHRGPSHVEPVEARGGARGRGAGGQRRAPRTGLVGIRQEMARERGTVGDDLRGRLAATHARDRHHLARALRVHDVREQSGAGQASWWCSTSRGLDVGRRRAAGQVGSVGGGRAQVHDERREPALNIADDDIHGQRLLAVPGSGTVRSPSTADSTRPVRCGRCSPAQRRDPQGEEGPRLAYLPEGDPDRDPRRGRAVASPIFPSCSSATCEIEAESEQRRARRAPLETRSPRHRFAGGDLRGRRRIAAEVVATTPPPALASAVPVEDRSRRRRDVGALPILFTGL